MRLTTAVKLAQRANLSRHKTRIGIIAGSREDEAKAALDAEGIDDGCVRWLAVGRPVHGERFDLVLTLVDPDPKLLDDARCRLTAGGSVERVTLNAAPGPARAFEPLRINGHVVRAPTDEESEGGRHSCVYVNEVRVPVVMLEDGTLLVGNTKADEAAKFAAVCGWFHFRGQRATR